MKAKLVNEFVHPGVGGYSLEQLEKDFYDIIKRYKLEVEPEGAKNFLAKIVGPEFDKGKISNDDDLQKIVIGNEAMPLSEKAPREK